MSALARPRSAAPVLPRARPLGRLAIAALHAELACSPKPGLVTPFSRGSHQDMDAGTFLRSLFALRGYFTAIAAQAATCADFAPLRQLGIQAERGMLSATGNVNTHRGAIFSLGLLVASAARLRAEACPARSADAVCDGVRQWRHALLQAPLDATSPGQRARARHAVPGVREQAAAGFPLLREVAVPALRAALADGLPRDAALLQTLMQLVAVTDDLNLLHRGGAEGLAFAQAQARDFLAAGGVRAADASAHMARICNAFEQRRLSPGGSADLLACALFLLQQEAA
ncbi:triphosphoribosyl-dephospho-CoA synthase [Stenotrophomonas maltophilia]|uniref:triphosphoribosyl-dephospho-CoA synthase MdcB n=1 Tax=Stenotrophomonas chelatiphaga TaxID=517011 RepID=UPI000F4BABF4|nr:triphosphoribosyl-dephospho-CoA synthase MdcB [Stenotrophomonas chelatiphaga]MCS4229513.1 triphosphoribosyl-dephospho-CoA synthase [Stenotrophomonas chelatiphaga]ROQ46038.1 triphosphoribosyl-dephospho-CoA synthase [Stenotrophomonas maltophilia]